MNYCGIDVAKRKHSAMVLNEKSEVVKQNFTFKNDRQGFNKLLHELESSAISCRAQRIPGGLIGTFP